MKSLSCLYDSQNEKYIISYSALLVFVLTVMIPINLHLTRLSFGATAILLAFGFLSLFMIARNDKVGFGLLRSLRIGNSNLLSQKIEHPHFNSADNYQDPIVLLQNFVDEINMRHDEATDWTTLDSFSKINVRLSQLAAVKSK